MNQLYRTQLEEFRHASSKHHHHIAKTIFHFCNAIGKPQQTFKFQIQIWLRKSRNLIQKCKKRNRKPTAKHKNISTKIQETQNRKWNLTTAQKSKSFWRASISKAEIKQRRLENNSPKSNWCSWHLKTICMLWNAENHSFSTQSKIKLWKFLVLNSVRQ